jgi:hypothetical protein
MPFAVQIFAIFFVLEISKMSMGGLQIEKIECIFEFIFLQVIDLQLISKKILRFWVQLFFEFLISSKVLIINNLSVFVVFLPFKAVFV